MVNTAVIDDIIAKYDRLHPEDPVIEQYWLDIVGALGNDETEIVDYFESLNVDKAAFFDCVYEEMIEKFPGGRLERFYDDVIWKQSQAQR